MESVHSSVQILQCLNCHIENKHKPIKNPQDEKQSEDKNLNGQENEANIPKSPALKCSKCPMHLDDPESLKKHLQDKHLVINVYNCKSCDYKTTSLDDFKVHVETIHLSVKVNVRKTKVPNNNANLAQFKCSHCEYQCRLRKQLLEHNKSKHVSQCDECGYITDDKEKMADHKNSNHAVIEFDCDVCNFTTRTPYVMQRHKVDVHKDREEARYNTMQELFLTGLAAQVDNLMVAVIGSKDEVLEQLTEIKAKNDVLETDLKKTRQELFEMKKAFQTSNVFSNNMQNDSEAMLRNVSDRCSKLEDVAEKISKKENEVKVVQEVRVVQEEKPIKKKGSKDKHHLTWVGTSISKVLNHNKFEHDVDVKLTAVKAYCVKEEGRFPKDNFQAIVPKVVRAGNIDTLVLETGSIEITNLDVHKAMNDPKKDIKEYKKEWFLKAEEASNDLFRVAEEAIEADKNLNVIIVKRLPRFDRGKRDIMMIKSTLS